MAQPNQKNNPLAPLEAEIFNALTNVETDSKYLTENEKAITELQAKNENLKETIELNLQMAESMKLKKTKILTATELLQELGPEAAIAIELAGLTSPDPEPTNEPTSQETEPEPENAMEPKPEQTLDELTAELMPTEPLTTEIEPAALKPELPVPASELPKAYEVADYSFLVREKVGSIIKGDFQTPDGNHFNFNVTTSKSPASTAIQDVNGDTESFCYTSSRRFQSSWNAHIFALEKALQQHTGKELRLQFPPIPAPEFDTQEFVINKTSDKSDILSSEVAKPEVEVKKVAASNTLPGETASEQIANVQSKKYQTEQQQQSEASPVCFERDNYSFKFDNPQTKGFVKGEFTTPEGDFFKFAASGKNKKYKKYVGLQPEGSEFFTYTSNAESWKNSWDCHLSPIEKALQEFTGNKELAVKYPPRISKALAETKTERKVEYRDNELPFIDCVAVAKPEHINGYSISFVSCKDYTTKKGIERCGLKLKMVGEGTMTSGQHVFINFDKNSAEYEIGVEIDKKLVHDGKKDNREAMPKHLEPLRRAAILHLEKRLPEFQSRWESGVSYVTPDPEPKGPAGPTAAADDSVK